MVVRLRLQKRRFPAQSHYYQTLALAIAALLMPAALIAFTLAFWRIATDLRWTREFAISSGIFSHWQVWLAGAALLLVVAAILNRYGHNDNRETLP